VSDNVLCTENELIFQEASTQKKMSIKALDKGFEILVEEKFPFFRYAAILDGFIKILAFRKGIVSLHASAIIINNRSFVFGSWRRIGKSTIIVQLLMSKGTAQIIADDAVFLTNEGKIIPYLRGIDLYPYLPVPIDYLSNKERLQVLIAKNLKRIPGLPKQLVTKGIKKLFLPRINFGEFLNTPLKYPITPDVFYKLNRNTDNFSSINKVSSTSISSFYGRSSYYEMSEYQ